MDSEIPIPSCTRNSHRFLVALLFSFSSQTVPHPLRFPYRQSHDWNWTPLMKVKAFSFSATGVYSMSVQELPAIPESAQ